MEVLEQSGSIQILLALGKKGPLTLKELKKRVDASMVSMVTAIPKLEEIGLVEERLEDKFPRRKIISLTEKGEIVAEKLNEIERLIKLIE